MFRRIILTLALAVLATPALAQSEPASSTPALWLNVTMNSPMDDSTVKAELPLSAVSSLIKALPDSVLSELDEMKVPTGLLDILARSLANAEPLTILHRVDKGTEEEVKIWTAARKPGDGNTKAPKILRIDYTTDDEEATETQLALPLDSVDVIATQLEQLELPMEFFKNPDEMKMAIEAVVKELKVTTPGDLLVVESPEENIHVWVE